MGVTSKEWQRFYEQIQTPEYRLKFWLSRTAPERRELFKALGIGTAEELVKSCEGSG